MWWFDTARVTLIFSACLGRVLLFALFVIPPRLWQVQGPELSRRPCSSRAANSIVRGPADATATSSRRPVRTRATACRTDTGADDIVSKIDLGLSGDTFCVDRCVICLFGCAAHVSCASWRLCLCGHLSSTCGVAQRNTSLGWKTRRPKITNGRPCNCNGLSTFLRSKLTKCVHLRICRDTPDAIMCETADIL